MPKDSGAAPPADTGDTAAGTDTGEDSPADSPVDTGDDSGQDTGEDTTSDTGEDTAEDTATDTAPDGPTFDLDLATAKLTGADEAVDAGETVAAAGDTDADGAADLLVSAPYAGGWNGNAYLVAGPIVGTRSLDDADVRFQGNVAGRVGSALSGAGDMDGDGRDDVPIGAASAFTAWLVLGGSG